MHHFEPSNQPPAVVCRSKAASESIFLLNEYSFLPSLTRWSALVLALSGLASCGYAPGFSIQKGLGATSISTRSNSSNTGVAVMSSATQSEIAMRELVSITPDLIREQRADHHRDVSPDVRSLFGVAKPYQIGPGDVVNIVVWDHPELVLAPAGSSAATDISSLSTVGNGYNVSADGYIQFPYVGSIKLGGLTEFDARDVLTKQLSKYVKQPRITLRIQSYRSGRVYVDGEVRTPGLLSINDIPMTLPEVINRAGGFTALADRSNVSLSRAGKTTAIDLQQLTELGINPSCILLSMGDMVRVLSKDESRVYVLGEVTRPVAQPLRNDRLSLNEALGEAGGINTATGDPKQVYVVRSVPEGLVQIFHLDASSAMAYALSEGFALKPRDVVYVDPAPVVRWNRLISQILPSALAINNTSSAVNR